MSNCDSNGDGVGNGNVVGVGDGDGKGKGDGHGKGDHEGRVASSCGGNVQCFWMGDTLPLLGNHIGIVYRQSRSSGSEWENNV